MLNCPRYLRRLHPTHHTHLTHLTHQGLTLLELCIALAVVAILASLAYPAYRRVVQQSRRMDAHVALMQLVQAQTQWRVDHPHYGQLHELGAPSVSAQGYYQLQIHQVSTTGFEVWAIAMHQQASDTPCQVLRIRHQAGHTVHESGTDALHNNMPNANRQCWAT
jgi:type IV pilus assembly protein PilE